MPRLDESGPFQGSYGQPRETIQYLLGPTWATFRPTKFKLHYVAPQFCFSADRLYFAKISFIEMRTYFSFGLILRDIPNSLTPQTTLCLLPLDCSYSLVPASAGGPPPLPVPVTGVRYNSLLWMCTLNTLTWPDLILIKLTLVVGAKPSVSLLLRPRQGEKIAKEER